MRLKAQGDSPCVKTTVEPGSFGASNMMLHRTNHKLGKSVWRGAFLIASALTLASAFQPDA
jgi:hypothetical protein